MNPDTREFGLGRLPSADSRDASFPMRALFAAPPPRPTRFHRTGPVLDQGNLPQCVGFAWRQLLNSSPIMQTGGPSADQIYLQAQEVDEWPGTDYAGTSVRAGAKVLHDRGYLASYHWAINAEDVRLYVLGSGPVVIGTEWLSEMFDVDRDGFIPVRGFGVGGHAYLVCGFSAGRNAFRVINSWGKEWGQSGRAWLRFADLGALLANGGEACAAQEIRIR